jgi:hypothetical protein
MSSPRSRRRSISRGIRILPGTDLLFDEWDCLQSDSGIYQIGSVNTL